MDQSAFLARFRRPGDAALQPHPGDYAMPEAAADWQAFAAVLHQVGGGMLAAPAGWRTAVQGVIDLDPGPVLAAPGAQRLLAGTTGWREAGDPRDPRAWEGVGLAVLAAEVAVAENAALLITAAGLPGRGLAFLAQRLLVLVPSDALVPDLIAGQRRLAERERAGGGQHAVWMSGPSKTADIEQCLVIGAHGARALTVAVVDPA